MDLNHKLPQSGLPSFWKEGSLVYGVFFFSLPGDLGFCACDGSISNSGPPGETGPPGPPGHIGLSGLKGARGDPGSRGTQGPSGSSVSLAKFWPHGHNESSQVPLTLQQSLF